MFNILYITYSEYNTPPIPIPVKFGIDFFWGYTFGKKKKLIWKNKDGDTIIYKNETVNVVLSICNVLFVKVFTKRIYVYFGIISLCLMYSQNVLNQ